MLTVRRAVLFSAFIVLLLSLIVAIFGYLSNPNLLHEPFGIGLLSLIGVSFSGLMYGFVGSHRTKR